MAFPVGKKSLSNLLKICHQKWDIFNDFVKELDGVHWLLKAVLLLAFIIQQEVFWGMFIPLMDSCWFEHSIHYEKWHHRYKETHLILSVWEF